MSEDVVQVPDGCMGWLADVQDARWWHTQRVSISSLSASSSVQTRPRPSLRPNPTRSSRPRRRKGSLKLFDSVLAHHGGPQGDGRNHRGGGPWRRGGTIEVGDPGDARGRGERRRGDGGGGCTCFMFLTGVHEHLLTI